MKQSAVRATRWTNRRVKWELELGLSVATARVPELRDIFLDIFEQVIFFFFFFVEENEFLIA